MPVTRLIVAFNSAQALAWQAAASAPLPTLVVDNASRDGTAALAADLGFRVLALGHNAGFGRGVMAGLAMVTTEFALIVNPDAAVDAASVDALLAAARAWPECDVFVPRLTDAAGATFFRVESAIEPRLRDRGPPEGDCCVRMISGAVMFVRVQPFRAFGGFDPAFFLYFEDDDLALRYRAARRPMIHVAAARAVHLGDRSATGDADAHRIKDRSFGWSRIHLERKHGAGSGFGTVALMLLKLVPYLLAGRRQRLRRQWQRLGGALVALSGRPAPFLPGQPEGRAG